MGDFSSKLLQRAREQSTEKPTFEEVRDAAINFETLWNEYSKQEDEDGGEFHLDRALRLDEFNHRNPTLKGQPFSTSARGYGRFPTVGKEHCSATGFGKGSAAHSSQSHSTTSFDFSPGQRRQAMQACLQPSESFDSNLSAAQSDPDPKLQHGATFHEGEAALPVKNTFIHFRSCSRGPGSPEYQWSSAPAIMTTREFITKYPTMEPAHIRGDCRPCAYFSKKRDGCRWGADCDFCHLCPQGSFQRKRREKVKAIKDKEHEARENRRHNAFKKYDPRT